MSGDDFMWLLIWFASYMLIGSLIGIFVVSEGRKAEHVMIRMQLGWPVYFVAMAMPGIPVADRIVHWFEGDR